MLFYTETRLLSYCVSDKKQHDNFSESLRTYAVGKVCGIMRL
jgi:hypothetical protein